MQHILFLCTGNYYRSRFAEELVNHANRTQKLPVRAESLGLARNIDTLRNPGPMSVHTKKRLSEMGIDAQGTERFPREAFAHHFEEYDRVIALSLDEHKPMMQEHFPQFADKIEYWEIEDLHLWKSSKALSLIEEKVKQLLEEYNPS